MDSWNFRFHWASEVNRTSEDPVGLDPSGAHTMAQVSRTNQRPTRLHQRPTRLHQRPEAVPMVSPPRSAKPSVVGSPTNMAKQPSVAWRGSTTSKVEWSPKMEAILQ